MCVPDERICWSVSSQRARGLSSRHLQSQSEGAASLLLHGKLTTGRGLQQMQRLIAWGSGGWKGSARQRAHKNALFPTRTDFIFR